MDNKKDLDEMAMRGWENYTRMMDALDKMPNKELYCNADLYKNEEFKNGFLCGVKTLGSLLFYL